MVSVRFSLAEKAYIINYADYCMANKVDYAKTAAAAFQTKFKREMTWSKLEAQWRDILRAVFKVKKPTMKVFKEGGSRCVEPGSIANAPDAFLSIMNRQRKKMGLDKLEANEDTEGSADDWSDQDIEESDEEDAGDSSSPRIISEAAGDTEIIGHEDVHSSDKPMLVEETPGISSSQGAAVDGNDSTAASTIAIGEAPFYHRERAGATTETSVKDTATAAAVILKTTPPILRPTPSPITPRDVRPEASERVLGKRKASEGLVDDASLSKRPDRGRLADSLKRGSEVETTGGATRLSNKKVDDGHAVNEARVALQLACALYRTFLDSGKDVPHDLLGTIIQRVQRISNFSEDAVLDMALKDAESQRKLKEKSEDMVASLVGELEYNTKTVFPKTPSHEDVDREWRAFQQHVMYTAGHNSSTPTPRPGAAGYLSRSAEAIADGCVSADDLEHEIEALRDCLVSPHTHQTLLSALICRWIFISPETMSEDHHPLPVMKILEATKFSGLHKVQHIDKLMTQQMFTDPQHLPIIARRERLFCQDFTKVVKALCKPHALQAPPIEHLASAAIALKHKLMLSPDDYRIRYCRPETLFDPLWMQAVDAKNFPIADTVVIGKEITLCMFPALMSQRPEAFSEDAKIEDALVVNKRFFPTSNEKKSLDPSLCLSKATVLVLL